jgi:hypothetical protein
MANTKCTTLANETSEKGGECSCQYRRLGTPVSPSASHRSTSNLPPQYDHFASSTPYLEQRDTSNTSSRYSHFLDSSPCHKQDICDLPPRLNFFPEETHEDRRSSPSAPMQSPEVPNQHTCSRYKYQCPFISPASAHFSYLLGLLDGIELERRHGAEDAVRQCTMQEAPSFDLPRVDQDGFRDCSEGYQRQGKGGRRSEQATRQSSRPGLTRRHTNSVASDSDLEMKETKGKTSSYEALKLLRTFLDSDQGV